MPPTQTNLETRLEKFLRYQELAQSEPDPFRILNVTRTEAPYTHFIGWLLDPNSPHPWRAEFLTAVLRRFEQPLPPPGPVEFCVESFCFDKGPSDAIGFTNPDILALAPNRGVPTWCLIVENKFDSKEGRAAMNATQCASYALRARSQFGPISYALLFTTKTGLAAAGGSGFTAVGYRQLAEVASKVRNDMETAGRWPPPNASIADRFACYFVDTFLRHIDSLFPDDDVRAALRKLAAHERPATISSAWLASHPNIQEIAAGQEKALDRWDLDAMRTQLTEQGATEAELQALDAIFAWGEQYGDCDFQASGKASFVIRIPTCGDEVRILTIQGRKLRFYWGHFIGGYDETKRPNRNCKKFPHAYELAEYYCQRLNAEFGWSLEVLQPGDGFCEPSRPIADVSEPAALSRFLAILGDVTAKAKTP